MLLVRRPEETGGLLPVRTEQDQRRVTAEADSPDESVRRRIGGIHRCDRQLTPKVLFEPVDHRPRKHSGRSRIGVDEECDRPALREVDDLPELRQRISR